MGNLKQRVRSLIHPLAGALVRAGISANTLTVAGLVFNGCAGFVIASGALTLGGVLYLLFSCLDFLDGAVARLSGQAGPFGAFLDSVLDRASEAAVLVGLIYYYARQERPELAVLSAVALTGSFLVSYARARAEGLGLDCEVGWLQRPERIVLLGAGLVLSGLGLPSVELALGILAVVTAITTVQRIRHVARLTAGVERRVVD